DLAIETDRSVADVALAYTMAAHCLGAGPLREQILGGGDGGSPGAAHASMEGRYWSLGEGEDALREAAGWLLHFLPEDVLWTGAGLIGRSVRTGKAVRGKDTNQLEYSAVLSVLRERLRLDAPNAWRRVEQNVTKHQELGVPEPIAREVGLTNQWPKVF